MARVDRLAVREFHLIPVRIAQQAKVADDGAGVDGLGDEDTVSAPRGRRGIDLFPRREGEAQMLQRRGRDRRFGRHLEEHQHEVRSLLPLAQPHDARAAWLGWPSHTAATSVTSPTRRSTRLALATARLRAISAATRSRAAAMRGV